MSIFSRQFGEVPSSEGPLDGTRYAGFACGEFWVLGDSPVVGLMLDAQLFDREIIGAPTIELDGRYTLNPDNPRKIAVYRSIDSQFIMNDFFDKMQYQYSCVF